MKTTMCKIKNTLDGINRLDTAEKKTGELGDTAIKCISEF